MKDRKIRVATMNEKAAGQADAGSAARGFSWRRWRAALERLCCLGEMCTEDEQTLDAFKKRVGLEKHTEWRGESGAGNEGKGGEAGLERAGERMLAEGPFVLDDISGCEELERYGEHLLTERAVLAGVSAGELWRRRSPISFGGACWMMHSADGAVAVNLPREDDWQLLPALFGVAKSEGLGSEEFATIAKGNPALGASVAATDDKIDAAAIATWNEVVRQIAELPTERLVSSAEELGLAIAEVGSHRGVFQPDDISSPNSLTSAPTSDPIAPPRISQSRRMLSEAKVVDLSVMWAGPLCGDLLARAGAQVVKAESPSRPAGSRMGMPEFYERLNGRKQHRSIRFETPEGRAEMLDLLREADIVITSCRPRALEQMGFDPHLAVSEDGVIWAAITGYGWEHGHRVAFGDDAAAAGGLVAFGGESLESESLVSASLAEGEKAELGRDLPRFVGDALADPLTGVAAAVAVMEQWLSGSPAFLDISMAGSAASFCEMSVSGKLSERGSISMAGSAASFCEGVS